MGEQVVAGQRDAPLGVVQQRVGWAVAGAVADLEARSRRVSVSLSRSGRVTRPPEPNARNASPTDPSALATRRGPRGAA